MSSEDLDAFLSAFREQGSPDSEGVFTLDPVAARQKLSRYQFANPYQYALLLVSAAVLGGARRLEVTVDSTLCSFSDDGRPLSLPDLTADLRLERGLPAQPRARALALALVGAQALGPKVILVYSGGHRLVCDQGWSLENAPEEVATRIVLIRQLPKRFFGLWAAEVPEPGILEAHCALAATIVTVNGRSLQRRLKLSSASASALIGDSRRLPPWDKEPDYRFSACDDYSAVLGLHKRKQHVELVVDGVQLDRVEVQLGGWGFQTGVGGLVACDGLARDLSGLGVAQNARFHRLRDALTLDACWLALLATRPRNPAIAAQVGSVLMGYQEDAVKSWPPRLSLRYLTVALALSVGRPPSMYVYYWKMVNRFSTETPDLRPLVRLKSLSRGEELTRLYLLLEGARRLGSPAAAVRYIFCLLDTVAAGLDMPQLIRPLLNDFQRSRAFTEAGQAYLSSRQLSSGSSPTVRERAARRISRLGVSPRKPQVAEGPDQAVASERQLERLLKMARRAIRHLLGAPRDL